MTGPVVPEDLHSAPYELDPFPFWERLRHEQPLFHDTVDDRWLLTRYDDVVAVFRDHETYSTLPYRRIFTDVIGPTMVQMDGPDHDIRRAIVAPEMVGRKLETNYVPLIADAVTRLLEPLPAAGRVDLIDRFTSRLPLLVIATVLGLDERDHEFLYSVTGRVIAALAGVEPARSDGIAAHAELERHIDAMITERSERPTTDLVSGIAHGETETGERLSRREIASVAGVDAETVDAVLGDLEVALRTRGIRLIASGERVQLATAPEAGELIARYTGAEGTRLSPAALETLAIVAYRQPVTRGGIERIRGVDSDYVVRSLLHRRLVMEVGRAATPGRPILYGTGFDFLERFGLTSLDELPVLDTDVAARLAEEGAQEAADAEAESAGGGPAGTDPAPAADGSDEA